MNQPPPDIVPPRGLTRETLLRLNDAVGKHVTVTLSGEVETDVDGIPSWVGPSRTQTQQMVSTHVTRAELERAGLTPEDVPNLTIHDTPKEN